MNIPILVLFDYPTIGSFYNKYRSKGILQKFRSISISTKLDKGFRLVYKLSYLVEVKFWSIFAYKGGPLPKKSRNFFLNQIWQFLHQSKALVEFSRNVLLPIFFWMILGLKNPISSVKTRYFKWRFEISCFWPSISKKSRFLIF